MDRPGSGSSGSGATASTGGLAQVAFPQVELQPGTMVGEYRIEGELGRGGMGRVYSAVHPLIAKRAAIKVLHPELSVNQDAVDRFVVEARAVNEIGHPSIVDIFSFGALPDGRCYFVMEWLRGESLRERASKGLLPLADTMAILETVAAALEAAHDAGIVHRDLKPDNVFLSDTKVGLQVKLLDFGIAKLLGPDVGSLRTNTGNMIGTPAYMSPEQARGQGVDYRTDIYALGAMTFELLTGSSVFPAESAADMVAKHLYEPPRAVTALNPNVPAQLDALVAQMLAKAAHQRPALATVREVFRAYCDARQTPMPWITPVAGTPAVTPPPSVLTPVPEARRSRAWLAITIAAILAGGGLAIALALRDRGDAAQPASQARTAEPPPVQAAPPPAPAPQPATATQPAPPAVAPQPPAPAPQPATAPATPAVAPPAAATVKRPTKPKPKPPAHSKAGSAAADDDAPM